MLHDTVTRFGYLIWCFFCTQSSDIKDCDEMESDSFDNKIQIQNSLTESNGSHDEIQIQNNTVNSLTESSSRPGEGCNDGLSLKSFYPHSSQNKETIDLKLECNDIQLEDCPKNECKLYLLHFWILCIILYYVLCRARRVVYYVSRICGVVANYLASQGRDPGIDSHQHQIDS